VAYDVIARGAGYPRALAFQEVEAFAAALPGILDAPGPVFVALKVLPEVENTPIGGRVRWNPRTRDRVIADLRAGLGGGGLGPLRCDAFTIRWNQIEHIPPRAMRPRQQT
jgi:hypothetical protein